MLLLLVIAVALVLIILQKKKQATEEKTDDEIIKTNLEILPIRSYDEDIEAFVLEDGSYFDFFEIVAKDRNNMQSDIVSYDIYNLARFEKLFGQDHKDFGLNFPINTAVQKAHLVSRLKATADPVRKEWLIREIEELEELESFVDRKEFYRAYFAKTKDELVKSKQNIKSWIGYGRNKLVAEVSKEKKIQIVRKLCNMNTLVLPDELREVIE